jgi:16S rRNA (cytidine1402-2'-O)-methyltransferase
MPERGKRIQQLEQLAKRQHQTQIFIETPYRNNAFLNDLLKNLSPDTLLCVASDLTLPSQFIKTRTVFAWKNEELPNLDKRPTIFLYL